MTPGVLQQQRVVFARLPVSFLRFGSFLRWLGWALVGWPATFTPVVFAVAVYITVLTVKIVELTPWGGSWNIVSGIYGWMSAQTVTTNMFVVGATAGLLAFLIIRARITRADVKVKMFTEVARFGLLAALMTWLHLNNQQAFWVGTLSLVLFWVDIAVGRVNPALRLLRMYSQLNREFPTVYAQTAARTKKIQDWDRGPENDTRLIAKGRPLLEHPARWALPNIDFRTMTTEQVVIAPPGRTLAAFAEILPTLAANWPWARTMKLVQIEGQPAINEATAALWVVEWESKIAIEQVPMPTWLREIQLPGWLTRRLPKLAGSDDPSIDRDMAK